MSVDYYSCSCCKESIYEEDIAHCEECGERICNSCLVNLENVDWSNFYSWHDPDGQIFKQHCPLCSGDTVSNKQRIDKLLVMSKISLIELDKIIISERKEKKGDK